MNSGFTDWMSFDISAENFKKKYYEAFQKIENLDMNNFVVRRYPVNKDGKNFYDVN